MSRALLAPLLLLAALFGATGAEASLTRVSAVERTPAPSAPSPSLERALAFEESESQARNSGFDLFIGDELSRAFDTPRTSAHAGRFHPLAAVSLLSNNGAEPLLVSADPLRFQKTRIGVFDFLGSRIVGVERGVSLDLHWGCGDFSCRFSEGIGIWLSQDPLGDKDSPNLYGFVGARPHERTDPLGLALGDWWDPRTYADAKLAIDLGHDLLNAASLGTLNRVERQKNLGTVSGVLESAFNAGRSVSNAASFGLQEEIYESQMRNGPGLASVGRGVQNWAYNLTPMEEIRQLAQEGDQMSGGEKAVAIATAISKTAGLLAGAKSFGEAGAARYYRSRVTATYQRAVADYEAQGMSPTKVGYAADKATKIWARRNLKDFSQSFDPATRRTYADSLEGAQPDILLPKYGLGLELKTTFGAAWRAQGQFGKFVDLFPEYNIEYVLGKGGWVSPTGTPASLRAYLRSVLANAGQQGARP